jgi:hypothetical protein
MDVDKLELFALSWWLFSTLLITLYNDKPMNASARPSMSPIIALQPMVFLILLVLMNLVGCTAPNYLTVPPADLADQQHRGLSPSVPAQAIVREQHLGQLEAEMRYQEEVLLRAEESRLQACRASEATQVDSVAYQRCQLKDQLYEQLKVEAATARDRYLRAVSGRGGLGR